MTEQMFTISDLQLLSKANADRFIEMLYNQQERNEYDELSQCIAESNRIES